MQRFLAFFMVAALAMAAPALAKGKPEKVGMPKKLVTVDEHGKGQKGKPSDKPVRGADDVTAAHGVFDRNVRDQVRDYYARNGGAAQASGHCPPGLAKKNNGCLPPGQAKKRYEIGEALPADLRLDDVPRRLLDRLPPPPDDSFYGVVDGSIVRIGRATGKILEAVDILSGL
ncbi:MAG: hypothetical protein R3C97_16100 [Geminicoccaceae bacterium]